MRKIRIASASVLIVVLLLSLVSSAFAYSHPGGLVTGGELAIVKSKVDNNISPWKEAYDRLMVDANQALSVTGNAIATLNVPGYYANPSAHDAAKLRLEIDAQGAYAAALAYRLNGNTVYANKARDLLNNWAYTNTQITGTDGRLVSAYIGVGLINAADLLKDYSGWSAADKTQFGSWLTGVLIPIWDTITFTSNWRDWSLYAQIAAYQFLDDSVAMASEIEQLKTQIDVSIASDGFLPDETIRGTNSLWYHYFALGPMTAAAEIVKNAAGVDLYNWVSPSGKSIKLALDTMFYYVNGNVSAWPPAYGGGNQTFSNARNLYEAMAEVYQDANYEVYVRDSRPFVGRLNYTSNYYHNHAWVYPTLLRTVIPPLPTNVALGKPVTVDSTYNDHVGSNIVDGIISNESRWLSANTSGPHWAVIDFGTNRTIGSSAIYTGVDNGSAVSSFVLQSWDGSAWVNIPGTSVTGNSNVAVSQSFTSPVTTDKVRFYTTNNGHVRVKEIKIYEAETPPTSPFNVALGKPVTVDSTFNAHVGANVVDGVISNESRWLSANTSGPHWAEIDFGTNQTISSSEIYTGVDNGSAVSSFVLQSWDGSAWVNIPGTSVTGNSNVAVSQTFTNPVTTNKVRFYSTDNGFVRVKEIKIFN